MDNVSSVSLPKAWMRSRAFTPERPHSPSLLTVSIICTSLRSSCACASAASFCQPSALLTSAYDRSRSARCSARICRRLHGASYADQYTMNALLCRWAWLTLSSEGGGGGEGGDGRGGEGGNDAEGERELGDEDEGEGAP